MKVAVVGASGYTGLELLRILLRHPEFEIAAVTSEQRAGRDVGDVFPALRGRLDLRFEAVDPAALAGRVELAFTALPHAASARAVGALRDAGVRVVDLSADFRLHSLDVYQQWYGEHPVPARLAEAVYGIPELHRDAMRNAQLVAAPGCYPTSALLPLAPLLRAYREQAARSRTATCSASSTATAMPTSPATRTATRRRSSRRRASSRARKCA